MAYKYVNCNKIENEGSPAYFVDVVNDEISGSVCSKKCYAEKLYKNAKIIEKDTNIMLLVYAFEQMKAKDRCME